MPGRVVDACAVPTAPLAAMLRSFVDEWQQQRPSTAGQFHGVDDQVAPVRALAHLAAESGISESTIQKILDRRYRTTELRVADALVSRALGRPDVFYDGTLPIGPNPSPLAPRAERLLCCGGSEQDAASMLAFVDA